jgi:FixJ family two-component response regulator
VTPPSNASATEATVLVLDDDESVRQALSSLFRSVGLKVRLFGNATELFNSDPPKHPSCLVLDIRLPGRSGLELQTLLAGKSFHMPVIIITGHGDIPMSVQALKAGAVDFLTKPFRDQDILDAVSRAVERDRKRLEDAESIADVQSRFESLTPRERDVLGFVTRGLMNKQIAAEMGISEITVKIHRGHVMRKMAAQSLPDLVRMADWLKANRRPPL